MYAKQDIGILFKHMHKTTEEAEYIPSKVLLLRLTPFQATEREIEGGEGGLRGLS